jgi:hypothetical protein
LPACATTSAMLTGALTEAMVEDAADVAG